jgi:hypothetical protein
MPFFNDAFGTRQIHVEPWKFISLVAIQRTQHSFSYPCLEVSFLLNASEWLSSLLPLCYQAARQLNPETRKERSHSASAYFCFNSQSYNSREISSRL